MFRRDIANPRSRPLTAHTENAQPRSPHCQLAYFHALNRNSPVRACIVRFRQHTITTFLRLHPHGHTREEYAQLAAIPLASDRADTLVMNIIAVHHPIKYLAQSIAFRHAAGLKSGALTLRYIAQLAGMLAGIAPLWIAIRLTPLHQFVLAALALLPGIAASLCTLNADAITRGFSFILVAQCFRAISRTTRIGWTEVCQRGLTALAVLLRKGRIHRSRSWCSRFCVCDSLMSAIAAQ